MSGHRHWPTSVGRRALVAGSVLGVLAQYGPALLGVPGAPRLAAPMLAGVGRSDHIALTFDDGPHHAGTAAVLDVLAAQGVSATFFLIADQLTQRRDEVRRIVRDGHEIGLHGWDHRPLPFRNPARTMTDLRRARDMVEAVGCVPVTWYRPPYGAATGAALLAARSLGLRPVWWTAWGRDWAARTGADSIVRTVLHDLAGGGVVLLHDSDRFATPGSWRRTAAALPRIITECVSRGYRVGPLRDHWSAAVQRQGRLVG